MLNTIRKLKFKLGSQKGFTLIELILSLTVTGIVFGLASHMMIGQTQAFAFMTERKAKMSDVRFAINKMSHELRKVGSDDITHITGSWIQFNDDQGAQSSFRLNAHGSTMAVFRGNDVLIPDVESFEIQYLDGLGNEIEADPDNIEDIRRIHITVTTASADADDNGNISISTTIIPREFLGYANYQ